MDRPSNNLYRRLASLIFWTGMLVTTSPGMSQDQPAPAVPEVPVIPDEPKTIDPATLVSPPLAQRKTADLEAATVRELTAWLESECGLEVLVDDEALSNIGLLATDPVGERLQDTPVYQLLNRLRTLGLGWYESGDVLYLTSIQRATDRLTMVPYNVGDLLDQGYQSPQLVETLTRTIAPESWEDLGGTGVVSVIGDVIFVRQNAEVHLKVRGLLEALRSHGRQTFVADPTAHLVIREKLAQLLSVNFDEQSLEDAIAEIAEQSELDLRLDRPNLRNSGVRDRTPVTLSLQNRSLETILQALLYDLELKWILRDGVIWITTEEVAESFLKTAVYDVRDLCRDEQESLALQEAIQSQACEVWDACGGSGTLSAPKPGVLVLYNTEAVLTDVLQLLDAYRAALRGSKPRKIEGQDPDEVITVYYRLETTVADGLTSLLPRLVCPETWKTGQRPAAIGEILMTPSSTEIQPQRLAKSLGDKPPANPNEAPAASVEPTVRLSYSVLIIKQTRGCHEKIAEVIRRVKYGDAEAFPLGGLGGMGGMGGMGFGGGFFSLDPVSPSR